MLRDPATAAETRQARTHVRRPLKSLGISISSSQPGTSVQQVQLPQFKSMIRNASTKSIRGVRCTFLDGLAPVPIASLSRSALSRAQHAHSRRFTALHPAMNSRPDKHNILEDGPLAAPSATGLLAATRPISAFSPDDGRDTIYALSSGRGKAGIAIIRISGPACGLIHDAICPGKPHPKPRQATLRSLHHPLDPSNILDSSALVLSFPHERSSTGEWMLELHVHGGTAIVKSVLAAIPKTRCPPHLTIRYAEKGEFTRRAFENGRLDLIEVEALGDTLEAQTEQQRIAAVRRHSKVLGDTYELWRNQLVEERGKLEAIIDFSETEQFDEGDDKLWDSIQEAIRGILVNITRHQAARSRSELVRNGIRIALLGPPNVGKSSLVNLISKREVSIVSTEAGTTRDIVENQLDIRGYACSIADTAGLRSSPGLSPDSSGDEDTPSASSDSVDPLAAKLGQVELEGIKRAIAKAKESDVVIVLASIQKISNGGSPKLCYDPHSFKVAAEAKSALIVVNKLDNLSINMGGPGFFSKELLVSLKAQLLAEFPRSRGNPVPEVVFISCLDAARANIVQTTGKLVGMVIEHQDPGRLDFMLDKLVGIFKNITTFPPEDQDLIGVTERQTQLLAKCKKYLQKYLKFTTDRPAGTVPKVDEAAEALRGAADALGKITGRGDAGDVEEVLGVVFAKFCVGK